METEHCNSLATFCETYISQNGRNSIRESQFARAFVEFFQIPPLFDIGGLERFLAQANIEVKITQLPGDLLGVHMLFDGKGRIDLSQRPEQRYFQIHTVLHEIREIIENDLRPLGFGTAESQHDFEHCANEFAFYAIMFSQMPLFKFFFDDAFETESNWRKLGMLCLISIALLFVGSYSFVGAFFPHVTVTASRKRFER
jgi:hypothetical protein